VGKIAGRVRFSSAGLAREPEWHLFLFGGGMGAVEKIRGCDSG